MTLILSAAAVGGLVLFVTAAVVGSDDAPIWTAYAAPLWVPLSIWMGLSGVRKAQP
ncbi:hypothetical protein LRS12_08040 [Sphingomonas sp. J344]|uniref:hypothetical protein n=1 Tax=Sphingomonas sp. J344 TaxID=2898434 RepID=UPI0021519787|nr:hypothetical protein [Sphingomonas sp. J344]MCR5870656.1 hypothetical protein [Sphingomonas sp. J344]